MRMQRIAEEFARAGRAARGASKGFEAIAELEAIAEEQDLRDR